MANDFSMTDEQRRERIERFAAKFKQESVGQKWEIEKTDRFWHLSGRFSKTYTEVTFWYCPTTLERKETTRQEFICDGQEDRLPAWCKFCDYRKSLNYE